MLSDRLKEMIRQSGMTVPAISAKSEVPSVTINRILSGATPNPQFQTVVNIVTAMGYTVDALLYPEAGEQQAFEHPAQTPLDERMAQQYERLLAQKDELLASQDRRIEDKARALRHKDMWIKILAVAFGILLSFVLAALIIDVANHNVGWLRS